MFYQGWSQNFQNGSIGYATSPDGLSWTAYEGNPIITPEDLPVRRFRILAGTAALYDGSQWMLFFTPSAAQVGPAIYRATAPAPSGPWTVDAEPINSYETPAWDTRKLPSSAFVDENGYRLYYQGWNVLQPMQIGLITSEDGIVWTRYNDPATAEGVYTHSDPVFVVGEEGSWDSGSVIVSQFVHTPEGWALFYAGSEVNLDATESVESNLQLGYATSPDGIVWTKYAANPVFELDTLFWPGISSFMLNGEYAIYYTNDVDVRLITGTVTGE
jgi:hypothetical protein